MTHLNQINLKVDDETYETIKKYRLWGEIDNILMNAVKEYLGTSKK